MPRIWLRRGREGGIKGGYLWVHPSDVERISPSARDGESVDVMDSKDRFLGRALLNRQSPVVARLHSLGRGEWNEELVGRRILEALERRRRWGLNPELCRLVFGESDLLPGLVADRYGPALVLQVHHPAMERLRDVVVKTLREAVNPQVIFDKSDSSSRSQEGLAPSKGVLWGELPEAVWVREGEVHFRVNVTEGQKTGLYLDQKRNRMRSGPMAQGRRVLDLFCYTGGFGLHALARGAASATFVDSSAPALEEARENAAQSGWLGRSTFIQANAFDLLREMDKRGERYDMICMDPPAFAPTRRALSAASRGYKELNLRAFKLLHAGGILVSSSCSSHVPVGLHLQIITEAASDAGRRILLLHQWGQDLDHPVLPAHPPSRYLKCHVLEVIGVR
jgi:23S rRNA (cytosine1962-C5)-methyltransferase